MHAANHDGLAMLTGARFRALLRFPAQILTVKKPLFLHGPRFCLPFPKSHLTSRAIGTFVVSSVAGGWGLERGVGATRPGMKQDTIAKDATRNCGVEGGAGS